MRFSNSQVTPLGSLPGDTDSEAFAVNSAGEAIGYSSGPAHFHAAAFCTGGAVRDLGVAGGDVHSEALALNGTGVAVGDSDRDGFTRHAVLYGAGRVLLLDKLVANLPSGWSLARATGINDRGMIVAEAVDGTGTHHAALLTPSGPLGLEDVCSSGSSPESAIQSDGVDAPKVDGSTVLVHWDYMTLAGPDGHSDAPNPQGMALVQQAFAHRHQSLWIDPVHHAIPERGVVDTSLAFAGVTDPCQLCGLGADHDSYFHLKSVYFHPVQPVRWHYTLFANELCLNRDPNFATICARGEGGMASLGGKDDVVAQFNLHEKGFRRDQSPLYDGGTFMHELGHTLGLLHGGDEDANYKPNYLSVMNYQYEFGVPYAARPGSSTLVGYRLDYSGQKLPDLDENHLNEPLGLQSGTADLTYIRDVENFFQNSLQPTSDPIDYNGDGNTTDTDLRLDLNFLDELLGLNPDCAQEAFQEGAELDCLSHTVLHGFDDWGYITSSLAQDVTISSRHGGRFAQNGTGSYQLTVTNDGSRTILGPSIHVLDDPPPGWQITTIFGSGWTCSYDECSRSDSLSVGKSWSPITVTVSGGPSASAGPNIAEIYSPSRAGIYEDYYGGAPPSDLDGDWTDILPTPPSISGFTPSSGQPGSAITLSGSFLNLATQVDFPGGTSATGNALVPISGSSLTVTVPDGPSATGPLTVHTPGGTATSSQSFTVIGPPTATPTPTPSSNTPTITGFSPTSGPVGTSVTIRGANLAIASLLVTFSPASALDTGPTVSPTSINADGSIMVTVPQGAGTGPISVNNGSGTATTAQDFTVT